MWVLILTTIFMVSATSSKAAVCEQLFKDIANEDSDQNRTRLLECMNSGGDAEDFQAACAIFLLNALPSNKENHAQQRLYFGPLCSRSTKEDCKRTRDDLKETFHVDTPELTCKE